MQAKQKKGNGDIPRTDGGVSKIIKTSAQGMGSQGRHLAKTEASCGK